MAFRGAFQWNALGSALVVAHGINNAPELLGEFTQFRHLLGAFRHIGGGFLCAGTQALHPLPDAAGNGTLRFGGGRDGVDFNSRFTGHVQNAVENRSELTDKFL